MKIIAEFIEVLILLAVFVGLIFSLVAGYKYFMKKYINQKNKYE